MSDTIELLVAIGSDASLRYAAADELISRLEQLGASRTLQAAIPTGDSGQLQAELGNKPTRWAHVSQTSGQEEEQFEKSREGEPKPISSPEPAPDNSDTLVRH